MKNNIYDYKSLNLRFNTILRLNYNIDMTRGKPCQEQLDLSNNLINNINVNDLVNNKNDYRNYTNPQDFTGIKQLKQIFSELFSINENNIIIGGNSSISLLFDIILYLTFKIILKNVNNKIKYICPTPGYDRHFKILEFLGIEMISVPLLGDGPDMDIIENLVLKDDNIKGMLCVPKYSNPTGENYSYKTLTRLAKMKTLYKDFKIILDNAYAIHNFFDLSSSKDNQEYSILELFAKHNQSDRVIMFASTSKITYPGNGIAMIIANDINIKWIKELLINKTIGYDKINQIRHLKLFKNKDNILKHMHQHAKIIYPKFEASYKILEKELGVDNKFAIWTKPKGGYFISFNTKQNLAKRIVNTCLLAGIKLTPAGTTYPYGIDPYDSNIRISPTFLSIKEIQKAIEVLSIVTKIITIKEYNF